MYDGPNVLGDHPPHEPRSRRERLRLLVKVLLFIISVPILMSMGAQFYAAPVLLPAFWWAAKSSNSWGFALFTFLAAWLMALLGWVAAYLTVREAQPWIVVGPVLGFLGTITMFSLAGRRVRRTEESR